jgi:hypothetical protein
MNLNNLYQWNNKIFDDYILPGPITIHTDYEEEPVYSITLDHDLMTSAIMMRCGLLEPIYNDPVTFKSALETWFVMHRWNIEHLMRLACQNYNPLENYDRWEHLNNRHQEDGDEKEKHSGTDTETHSGDDIDKLTGTDTETHSGDDVHKLTGTEAVHHTGTVKTETTVSAFNESNYQPDNNVVETRDNTDTTTFNKNDALTHGEKIDTKYGKTDTFTHGENIDTKYGKNITTEFGKIDTDMSNNHIHGNIGVTTFTQMAEQEIALVKSFNIYDTVVSLLEDDLFIGVY